MGLPEYPAETDLQRLYRENAEMRELIKTQTTAINDLAKNIYWLLDMAKPMLEMLNSPMFASMAPGMMSMAAGMAGNTEPGKGGKSHG